MKYITIYGEKYKYIGKSLNKHKFQCIEDNTFLYIPENNVKYFVEMNKKERFLLYKQIKETLLECNCYNYDNLTFALNSKIIDIE